MTKRRRETNTKLIPKDKKGVSDALFIGVFLFGLMILFVIIYFIFSTINTEIAKQGIIPADHQAKLTENVNRFPKIFDGILMVVVIGLAMASVIGAFAIRSHPIFFFVAVIFLFVVGAVNIILKDTYFAFAENPEFAASASAFTGGTFILTKFPFIMAILGFTIAIITYSRGQPL